MYCISLLYIAGVSEGDKYNDRKDLYRDWMLSEGVIRMKKISIGITCYNEEENIELMYAALTKQLELLPGYDYEIIFEDNHSQDASQDILRMLAKKDRHVKVIFNMTNFGPMRSGTNCMARASGDVYMALPCDFQEPPEMLPEFIRYWEEGYDIVWGQKSKSEENPFKYFLRKVYYKTIQMLSDYPQLEQVTGFGVMDKRVLDTILQTKLQDPEIAVRHLVAEYGFDMKLVPYTQRKRLHGKSSYNVSRYFSFAITSLCNTSTKPLRIMVVIGMVTALLSLLCAAVYFVYKLRYWNSFDLGLAPIIIGLFFFSSVQLFCIGMLGEYVGVILRKMMDKPVVLEKERINFDEDQKCVPDELSE